MKKYLLLTQLVLVLALSLTSCSSTSNTASQTLDVTLTDFAFTPNSFIVPAGQSIAFTAANNGATVHSFMIMKKGVQLQGHFADTDRANVFWGTDQILPGQTINATFVAPSDPGEYQIVCAVSGHLEAGMLATLIVTKP